MERKKLVIMLTIISNSGIEKILRRLFLINNGVHVKMI